jgi:molybdopterin-guanine dinucleotide biosynthesis protein A
MLGVVLCGGQSSRMGSDKGLLKLNDKTWTQKVIDTLSNFQVPIVISVNKKQYQDYSIIFPVNTLIPDDPSLQLRGPLYGLLSVHLKYPEEDLLLLACDMPLIDAELIKELLTKYSTEIADDAFIFTNDGEPEPMPGIYRSKGLAYVHQLYSDNQLPRHSMKYMLEHIPTFISSLPADKKDLFRNFNTHAELNGL